MFWSISAAALPRRFRKLQRAGILIRERKDIGAGFARITIGTETELKKALANASADFREPNVSRIAKILRNTKETQIDFRLNLDGRGKSQVSTGIRFFDHMLDLVARHGGFDLKLVAKGDLDVDQHHTVEDVGIALGEAVNVALGNKRGILRAGYFLMPMDETLAAAAIDFGGRPFCVVKGKFAAKRVGGLQTELIEDFFQGFALRRVPTCICAFCTGALRIIKSKRSSRRSPGRCVSPYRETNA